MDYAHLSIIEISELDFIDYLILRRDAFIYQMNKTEKGQEYLVNAGFLSETKPDRENLRKYFGKG